MHPSQFGKITKQNCLSSGCPLSGEKFLFGILNIWPILMIAKKYQRLLEVHRGWWISRELGSLTGIYHHYTYMQDQSLGTVISR